MVETDASLSADADRAMAAGAAREAVSLLERYVLLHARDHDHWIKLAGARRMVGDTAGALDASAAALRSRPGSFVALLMGGSLFETMGRREDAARAYRMALDVAPGEAMLSAPVRRQLERARALLDADQAWRRDLGERAVPDAATVDERARIEAFRRRLLETGGQATEPLRFPGLDGRGFHDAHDLPGVAALEEATDVIFAEYTALAAARAPERARHAGLADGAGASRQWSVLSLWRDGEIVADNAALCPVTMRLYEALRPPRIAGRAPNLMFSLLDPHTRIPAHRGVTDTRLVFHLPLVVPNDCGLRVAAETRAWRQGEAMLFDDTFDHEAWNGSDALRVILLGGVWNPELSEVEREAVASLMARH